MALKIFNKDNSRYQPKGNASLYFATGGCNALNKTTAQALNLKHGDKISIAQDEKDKRTFYLFRDDKSGFALRDYSKSGALAFNNTLCAVAACENFDDGRKSVSCKLILEPQQIDGLTVYPIIVPKQND